MITSRFNKDEAVDQREYMTSKMKRKRSMVYLAILVAMVVLFFVLVIAATPFRMDPFYMPMFPPVLSILSLGAALIGAGMYFRTRFWKLADQSARRPMMLGSGRAAMVFLVLCLMVLVIVLPLSPIAPKPNFAESMLETTGHPQVGPSTHIRLQFQGAGSMAGVHSWVSLSCRNNLSLDFYLMTKEKADQLGDDLAQAGDMSLASRTNATAFEYDRLDLDSGTYTVVIVNANNDTAEIGYTIHRTTSAELTYTLALFSVVYMAMAAWWVVHTRKIAAMPEVPVPLPSALVQLPPQPERPTVQRAPMGASTASGLASPAQSGAAAPSGPVSGGTLMAITCPRCSTTFDVFRGAGPTRIKCPSCGKEGTLAGLPMPPPEPRPEAPPVPAQAEPEAPYIPPRVERPAPRSYTAEPESPIIPAPVAARPMEPQAPEIPEAPALPAEPVIPVTPPPRRNMACPRCKQIFSIEKVEGPQHIRCPHCGKEGTIGSRAPPAPAAAPVAPMPRPAAAPAFPAQVPAAPAAPAPAPKMISCPACRRPFPVTETRRPLQVKCPNCGKEGMLRK
jgi:DNA-directed RNA polymerase subunit RPC12/RpoP